MNNPGHILLPTAYFPPVSYFVHLVKNPVIYIEQMETFPKQTYRNRCEIMTAAGKSNLIVPVTKPHGNHTMTRDIEICYREPWDQHHLKTIQTAYRSSPYFNYYSDIIQPLFEPKETSLLLHNQEILSVISKILRLKLSSQLTGDYIILPTYMSDLRSEMIPKKRRSANSFPEYPQVFSHKFGFIADLSILDLLFNMGPEAGRYLESIDQERVVDR